MDKAAGAVTHLRFPVVTAGSEYLVMGHLVRRNILTYKAPPNTEGYDLICIHPDPRHKPAGGQLAQVRVQVKSRYASDCDRGFPVKEASFEAFDFLVVVFLNIGNFYRRKGHAQADGVPEYYTLSNELIRAHHYKSATWQKVNLKSLQADIAPFRDDQGFDLIAQALGVPRPQRVTGNAQWLTEGLDRESEVSRSSFGSVVHPLERSHHDFQPGVSLLSY